MANEIQFLLYNMPEEEGKVQVVIKDDTIWCTQKAMAQLFGVGVPAISKHLKNIFEEGELQMDSVISKMETTAADNKNYSTTFYSLDAIIAVGYRVNSMKATRFRQWATKILNEYIRKGFVLDDDRLKQGTAVFGKDYFRELLERVRSIRASERRIWQQITDIYAECSTDYDRNSPTTKEFYAMVQNRFHYAITGQTAAEIIYTKADHTKEYMGIRQLERTVASYFDYIENQIERQNPFTMEQFAASVNKFLTFNDYKILPDKGRISSAQAKAKAESEYDIFNRTQRIDSDFDKEVRDMLGK